VITGTDSRHRASALLHLGAKWHPPGKSAAPGTCPGMELIAAGRVAPSWGIHASNPAL